MFNIIDRASNMLKTTPFAYSEILYEFTAEYRIGKDCIPNIEELLVFTGDAPEMDKISVTFSDGTSSVIVNVAAWTDSFEEFTNNLYSSDEVIVSIKIEKKIHDGVLNVYNLNSFSEFLNGRSYTQLFDIFAQLFKLCGNRIVFHLLDTNGSLRTRNIAFSDNNVEWKVNTPRHEQLKNCEDASIFLDKEKYPLLPQDFAITGPVEGSGFGNIKGLFEKLRSIWSYFYLANSAYIANEKAILQFDPAGVAEKYDFDDLTKNTIVPQIYEWAFKDDGCVDKASIARKIINVYCRSNAAILTIDEKLFNSIKSDYVIYQKNHADQYIDMKNKISECIVDSAKQMQELSHDVDEAFRNNFVAVIVFLMTVLLTDSIDFSQFLGRTVSSNVTAVCGIFTFGSILYLIATIIMGNQKWKWLEQSYDDLKANYNGTLDDQDIEEAFNHDQPIKTAKEQFKKLRCRMIGLWLAMIIGLGMFTGILYMNGNLSKEPEVVISDIETDNTVVPPSEDPLDKDLPDDTPVEEKNGEEQAQSESNGDMDQ
ncbi:MAG: hypothetical protein IJX90_11225 [Blautia sp.]|nr:hypothetical protein [Blautia sp.]